jgi:hypothetical protein
MRITRILTTRLLLLVGLLVVPALAHAQSSIVGVVRDSSGAVLPGVTVEAASEALIEKVKSTVSDSEGQFRIVDLRPGDYEVTFSLNGFQTLKRSGLSLPAEFSMTVNGELQVGQRNEVITVNVAAPLVDTQNAIQVTRLDRTALEALPSGQNIWELGQLIPGVQLSSPTVGGAAGATQTYMSIHGMGASQNVVLVDGLSVSGLEFNGAVQNYFNPANSQEIVYQTSGINADRSGGGITINMIPREGGNRFAGDADLNYRPGQWIGDNFTDRLKQAGSTYINSLEFLNDVTVSQGGPIKRDKLWFFTSFHQFDTRDLVANTFFDDGSQGSDAQHIRQGSGRLTYQLSPKNKISGYYEKIGKLRTNQMGPNTDPETASVRTSSPNYATGAVKLTTTFSNRLLLEAGYSLNREHRNEFAQEGILQERGSPAWFTNVAVTTNEGGVLVGSPTLSTSTWPQRDNAQASLSYITAAHNIKTGIQYQWGNNFHATETNGDLTARFDNFSRVGNEFVFTTPFDVTVRNTPLFSRDRLNYDIGIYAMDSWRMKRLTMNYGLRWENVDAQNDASEAPAGRFVPARKVPEVKHVPHWKDIAPRFNVVYDLFGNSKTAIKYGINRYNSSVGTLIANGFNTLSATTRQLPWTDLNGNGIPEVPSVYDAAGNPTYCTYQAPGCEINLTALRAANGTLFGTPADVATFDNYERTWNLEQSIEVQHELTKRVSVDVAWFHGEDHDLTQQVNKFRQQGDYTPFTIFNPVDGTPITVFGIKDTLTRDRLAQGGAVITFTDHDRKNVYNQLLYDVRARLPHNMTVSAGLTSSRETGRDCAPENPAYVFNPNEERFCDGFNLPDGLGVPLAHDLRLTADLPMKYGINVGIVYLNNDEGSDNTTYSVIPGSSAATSTVYPNGALTPTRKVAGQPAPPCPPTFGCVPGAFVLPSGFLLPSGMTTLSVALEPTGHVRSERLNQLDLRISKQFRVRNVRIRPTLNIANVFNSDHIIDFVTLAYASSAGTYKQPDDILLGRVIGFGATVKW